MLVKRVYALRTALHLLDYQDAAADDMKTYLQRYADTLSSASHVSARPLIPIT